MELAEQSWLKTTPDPYAVGSRAWSITLHDGTFVDLVCTGTFNGGPVGGSFVFTDSVQTLTNKSLADASTYFIGAADPTKRLRFDLGAAAIATNATIAVSAPADAVYSVPPVGTAEFVMTEGDQTVNGVKTFSNISFTTLSTDEVTEKTPGAGVTVENIKFSGSTMTAAVTDASVVLAPDGVGSFALSASGDPRGPNAIDLQTTRTGNVQVASGDHSAILYGASNSATAAWSTACGVSANASHDGSLVIADGGGTGASSHGVNTFNASFVGGYHFAGGVMNMPDAVAIGTKSLANVGTNTSGASTSTLYAFDPAMADGFVGILTTKLAFIDTTGNAGCYVAHVRVKKWAGVISCGSPFNVWIDVEAPLAGFAVSYSAGGITVTGVAARTITWTALVEL